MGHNENDENKIVAEVETERENSKQVLETIFYLNTTVIIMFDIK